MSKRWLPEHDLFLRENYSCSSKEDIMRNLINRTWMAIQTRARDLKITGNRHMGLEVINPIIRFNKKYKINTQTQCWEWSAGVHKKTGYAQFYDGNNNVLAHRFSYEYYIGPIPMDLELDHLCRVRHCVNPDHLEPVTCQTNVLRGVGPPAINAKKTFCVHGHEFTIENTYINPNTGGRTCIICRNLRKGHKGNLPASQRDKCPHGHKYDTINTHYDKADRRSCKMCNRIRATVNYYKSCGILLTFKDVEVKIQLKDNKL